MQRRTQPRRGLRFIAWVLVVAGVLLGVMAQQAPRSSAAPEDDVVFAVVASPDTIAPGATTTATVAMSVPAGATVNAVTLVLTITNGALLDVVTTGANAVPDCTLLAGGDFELCGPIMADDEVRYTMSVTVGGLGSTSLFSVPIESVAGEGVSDLTLFVETLGRDPAPSSPDGWSVINETVTVASPTATATATPTATATATSTPDPAVTPTATATFNPMPTTPIPSGETPKSQFSALLTAPNQGDLK